MSDRERQEDEVTALENICDHEEFSCFRKENIECMFRIKPSVENEIQAKYACDSNGPKLFRKFKLKHLPPTCLYIQLPDKYPSQMPPNYRLVMSWLSPWDESKICQRLDELWKNNESCEILFVWLEFLKNDLLSYLNIQMELDVSFLFDLYKNPNNPLYVDLLDLSDSRAINRSLFLHPMKHLMDYSKSRHKIEFQKNFHVCAICFDEQSGQKCVEFPGCEHICCEDCAKQYILLKIKDGSVKDILCPVFKCTNKVEPYLIKCLCPDLYSKYEDLMLHVTLSTMSDIVFCPRNFCQYPVTIEKDETLAICANCNYSFCIYCRKVYHGVSPCVMQNEEIAKLVDEYENGTQETKEMLEKKYGRRQIQQVVEQQLTKIYLEGNTKSCPKCNTSTSKIAGCNKMVCSYCRASFCWLCGCHITDKNAYSHFNNTGNNTCFGRLFEGIERLDEVDVLNNMNFFNFN